MIKLKIKKIISIVLYAAYALGLTFLIILGSDFSKLIEARIETMLSEKNIVDVRVDISPETELMAGKTYYPDFQAYGDYRGSPGLKYISLDPEYLTVGENGKLYANTEFEGDFLDARVQVSSKYNEGFRKIFTFRFVKKYPDSFSVSYTVKSYGKDSAQLYVDVPVYVFPKISTDSEYNMTDYSLVYDEEYFLLSDDGSLVPKRVTESGETLTVAIEYPNGERRESTPFEILPAMDCDSFDEVRLNGIPSDEYVGKRNDGIEVSLYKNGERLATDYTISLAKEQDAKRDGRGGMTFLSAGEKEMTLTLPNGFSATVNFNIENVVSSPIFKDETVQNTHVMNILDTDSKTYAFYFDGDVSYDTVTLEYDSAIIRASTAKRAITVRGKAVGTTTLKVIIDDGYDRVEENYTVNVKRNISPAALIEGNVNTFVSKVLGHLTLFTVFAFFAMNMFKFLPIKGTLRRFVSYTMVALPVAVITEFVQSFIPGRVARVQDILIDMLGFYFGTLLILLYRTIVSEIKDEENVLIYETLIENKQEKAESKDDSEDEPEDENEAPEYEI